MDENAQKQKLIRIGASVKPCADGKTFELLVGPTTIGASKYRFDADLYANIINNALDAAYDNGYRDGVNMVASGS